jgi:hypothetical protein
VKVEVEVGVVNEEYSDAKRCDEVVRGGLAGVRSGWNVDVKLGPTNQEEPEGRWGTQLLKSRRHRKRGKVDDV